MAAEENDGSDGWTSADSISGGRRRASAYMRRRWCQICCWFGGNPQCGATGRAPVKPDTELFRIMCINSKTREPITSKTVVIHTLRGFTTIESAFDEKIGKYDKNSEGRSWRISPIMYSQILQQVAQLSQRDCAAGWVSYGQKWKTGTGRQYFADIISPSSTIAA